MKLAIVILFIIVLAVAPYAYYRPTFELHLFGRTIYLP